MSAGSWERLLEGFLRYLSLTLHGERSNKSWMGNRSCLAHIEEGEGCDGLVEIPLILYKTPTVERGGRDEGWEGRERDRVECKGR